LGGPRDVVDRNLKKKKRSTSFCTGGGKKEKKKGVAEPKMKEVALAHTVLVGVSRLLTGPHLGT